MLELESSPIKRNRVITLGMKMRRTAGGPVKGTPSRYRPNPLGRLQNLRRSKDAAIIGGGDAIGTAIGAIAGGKKGAAIGAIAA